MDTPRRTPRHWDVAPLLVLGVVLGVLGSRTASALGAFVSLAGFLLLLVGLACWSRRSRQGRTVRANVAA